MMDELQNFIKEQISTTVFESLSRQSFIRRDTANDDENIRKIICSGVVTAFQQYKHHLDNQQTPTQSIRGQDEGPLELSNLCEHQDELKPKPTTTSTSISGTPTPSLTMTSQSTTWSDFTDFNPMLGGQFMTEPAELCAEPTNITSLPQPTPLMDSSFLVTMAPFGERMGCDNLFACPDWDEVKGWGEAENADLENET